MTSRSAPRPYRGIPGSGRKSPGSGRATLALYGVELLSAADYLSKHVLPSMGLTITSAEAEAGVPAGALKAVVDGHREIDEDLADGLARLSGLTPGFWLGLQADSPSHRSDHMPDLQHLGPSDTIEITGIVKWFNADEGYGFITPDGGGKDVFVQVSALNRGGLTAIEPNQTVRMRVVTQTAGGYVADAVYATTARPTAPKRRSN